MRRWLLTFALALLEPFFGARLAQAIPKFTSMRRIGTVAERLSRVH